MDRLKAVVIEDNELLAQGYHTYLASNGIDCLLAPTFAEAEKVLLTAKPDVILLDLILRNGSGVRLVSAIAERCPGVPIVVITGLPDEDIELEAIRKGAEEFLRKPVEPQELLRTVRVAIVRHETRREFAPYHEAVQAAKDKAEAVLAEAPKIMAEVSPAIEPAKVP